MVTNRLPVPLEFTQPHGHLPLWPISLLAPAVAFLLYLSTLSYPFVWDDTHFIVNDPYLESLTSIPLYFTDADVYPERTMYRPLRNVTWGVLAVVFGKWAPAFHALNVLLHALNCWLLFHLVRRILPGSGFPIVPLAGAMLFAVHPLNTEAVCWVKSMDDLAVTTFCLAASLAATNWSIGEAASLKRLAAQLSVYTALLIGAVLMKETGVILPGLAILAAWAAARADNRWPGLLHPATWRALLPFLVAGAVTIGIYLWVRTLVLGQVSQLFEPLASGSALVYTQIKATGHGLLLMVWPVGLNADYNAYPGEYSLSLPVLVSLLAIVALLGAAVAGWFRVPAVTLGVAWWLFAILPVSNIIPSMQFLAERFLYTPMVGASLLFAWIVAALDSRRLIPKKVLAVCLAVLLAALAIGTWNRSYVWSSPVDLFGDAARKAPHNVRALTNFADALFAEERYEEAVQVYTAVEEIDPDHRALRTRGEDARFMAANHHLAGEYFDYLDQHPGDHEVRMKLAELAWRTGRFNTARILLEEIRAELPNDWRPPAGYAAIEGRQGNTEAALQLLALARTRSDDTQAQEFLDRLETRIRWEDTSKVPIQP